MRKLLLTIFTIIANSAYSQSPTDIEYLTQQKLLKKSEFTIVEIYKDSLLEGIWQIDTVDNIITQHGLVSKRNNSTEYMAPIIIDGFHSRSIKKCFFNDRYQIDSTFGQIWGEIALSFGDPEPRNSIISEKNIDSVFTVYQTLDTNFSLYVYGHLLDHRLKSFKYLHLRKGNKYLINEIWYGYDEKSRLIISLFNSGQSQTLYYYDEFNRVVKYYLSDDVFIELEYNKKNQIIKASSKYYVVIYEYNKDGLIEYKKTVSGKNKGEITKYIYKN